MTALGLLLLAASPLLAVAVFAYGLIVIIYALGLVARLFSAVARIEARAAIADDAAVCLVLPRARVALWFANGMLDAIAAQRRVTAWGCLQLDRVGAWVGVDMAD